MYSKPYSIVKPCLRAVPFIFAMLVLVLASAPAFADWTLNLSPGVTPISQKIYNLHMTIMAFCLVIAVIVYGVLIYSLIAYRHSKRRGNSSSTDNNHLLEIVWTIIPFLILLIMAYPATKTIIDMEDFTRSDVTIKVTGHQWKWQYEYLDHGIEYFSFLSTPLAQLYGDEEKTGEYLLEVDRPLVLPVNRKVRFLVTSNDVIHSWWVPEFGIKRDAIPGYLHEAWARIETPGTYRGQCAELCGVNHAFMPIVVQAISENEFDQWIAEQAAAPSIAAAPPAQLAWTMTEALQRGEQDYERHCAACHGFNGQGIGELYPALTLSSVVVGEVPRHIDVVLHGVPGSAMQAFADQLDDEQLAAIITYERNAWGNNTGDLVTPEQVAEQRKVTEDGGQKTEDRN